MKVIILIPFISDFFRKLINQSFVGSMLLLTISLFMMPIDAIGQNQLIRLERDWISTYRNPYKLSFSFVRGRNASTMIWESHF